MLGCHGLHHPCRGLTVARSHDALMMQETGGNQTQENEQPGSEVAVVPLLLLAGCASYLGAGKGWAGEQVAQVDVASSVAAFLALSHLLARSSAVGRFWGPSLLVFVATCQSPQQQIRDCFQQYP
mmetsp:Transcript_8425/g.19918  ORF Transcript_8425/g.19918 Transcript_8425/m.19918 type:complete len:125 (-) Transcript_8425:564-938(-)